MYDDIIMWYNYSRFNIFRLSEQNYNVILKNNFIINKQRISYKKKKKINKQRNNKFVDF